MKIIQGFIPGNLRARPGRKMEPKFITVHNTGNTNKGANARGHAEFLKAGKSGSTGWHFTVDDKEIIQHIPAGENAYHADDGADGPGNTTSIGIEICENEDGDYRKAEANAVLLIRHLMAEFKIPVENVVQHRYWSGKYCPHRIIPRWAEFIETIQGTYTVKEGDTLAAIAGRFELTMEEIVLANPRLKDPDRLSVGDKIKITKVEPQARPIPWPPCLTGLKRLF
ncbi:putative peptidoglycan-binding domain-containing protein [Pelotomaculum thermopropionicum SI]|uniref:N-acetylmuramoyl-L-alanine amidase n=1 Tax=Pelotomaculum thermopropionicum (strain DSM 13744 / JCM 10971 / SI) TaxID=370438 RepID=A5D090_PELTS|nr:putative peptidoglycan-binding domain-containing protein [Pelotomaculum thermopropionicum SI]